MDTYLQERPDAKMLASSLISTLAEKLEMSQQWSCGQLLEYTQALKKTELDQTYKVKLQAVLDNKVLRQQEQATKLMVLPQSLTQVQNYLSKAEWDACKPSTLTALHTVVKRLKLCGVRSMKEDTKKWATAMLVFFEMERTGKRPCYLTIYQMSQQVAMAFAGEDTKAPVEPLVKYPASPLELGQPWLDKVYPDKDYPVNREVPGLFTLVKDHIPVRNTSALLTNKTVCNNTQPAPGSQQAQQAWAMTFLNQLGALATGSFGQNLVNQQNQAPQQPEVLLHTFQPKQKALPPPQAENHVPLPAPTPETAKPTTVVCLPERKNTPTEETADQENEQPEGEKTLESYEKATFEKLQARKKPAAHYKAGAKASAKPQAKGKSQAKTKAKVTHQVTKDKTKKVDPKGAFGCTRCRGNPKGCDPCRKPTYSGVRLNGRKAWESYMAKK